MTLRGSPDDIAKRLLERAYDAYRQADSWGPLSAGGSRAGRLLEPDGYGGDDDFTGRVKVREAVRLLEQQGLIQAIRTRVTVSDTPIVKPTALGIQVMADRQRHPVVKALSHMWERQAVPAALVGGSAGLAFGYLARFLPSP